MTVRIGFDMDGVLADFTTAFREVETRLFGGTPTVADEAPEVEAQQEEAQEGRGIPRRSVAARDAAAARRGLERDSPHS